MSLQHMSVATVLCPIDFSVSSDNALERAATLASWFHARLTVLHVIPYAPESVVATSAGDASGEKPGRRLIQSRSEVEQDMKKAIALFAGHAPNVEWEIAEGEPWRAIEDRASAQAADIVVMGNQGRSGWQRFLVGSTTEKLMRRLRCPVLAVGPSAAERKGLLSRRILCPLDLTSASRETIDLAFALAEENLAEVTLLHVLGDREASWDAAAEENARAGLRRLAEHCWTFCRTEARVATGTAWREIVRLAAEMKADLIVMGAHGEARHDTSFVGSTADQVLRHAECPVLLARPRAHRQVAAAKVPSQAQPV